MFVWSSYLIHLSGLGDVYLTLILSVNIQVITSETLPGLTDKTQQLREMGFSEDEISFAVEKIGKYTS